MSDFWVLRPFSPLFFLLFAFFLLVLIAASLLLRRKSERTRTLVLCCACWVTFLGFIAYKYALSVDAEFNVLTASMGGFNWWGELPLQLPGMGFEAYPVYLPRMLGYFGTHFMIFIEGLAVATFGLYRPRWRDIPLAVLALLVIALIVFGINMLLRVTGLHPKANYFFSVETEGNPLLELFYSWLPYPFLFLLPSVVIVAVYAGVITLGFAAADRLRAKKRSAVPASE